MINASERKLIAIAFSLLLVAACSSEPGKVSSPISPSSTPSSPQQPAASGDATVTGRVNPTTGIARLGVGSSSGVTVAVVGTGLSTQTNAEGRFELHGVPAGEVRLEFRAPGLEAELEINNVQHLERIEIEVIAAGSSASVTSSSRSGADGKVEIEGMIAAVDAAQRTLQVGSSLVHVPSGTVIRHGSLMFEFTDLRIGERVHIRGIPGASMVEAQEIQRQSPSSGPGPAGPSPSGNQVELKGAVSGLTGTCSSLTFAVSGTAVATNDSTQFKHAPCSAIADGVQVEVKGTLEGGSVLATEVEVQRPAQLPPSPAQPEVELQGAAAGVAGTCPTLTFTVNGTAVATNSSTQFEDAPCSAIAVGTQVEVKGTLEGGTVLAREVEIRVPAQVQAEVEVEGVVSGFGGACPGLSFTVNGTPVTTSSSTLFRKAPCSTIANGVEVEVKGTMSGATLVAQRVDIEVPEVEEDEAEVEGIVSSLGGNCVSGLTFTVNGRAVTTSSSTVFRKGPCSAIANGVEVEVKGTMSGATLVAQRVDVKVPEVEEDEAEVKGTVSSLVGSCASGLTFTVNGRTVTTNGSTRFKHGSCSAIAIGTRVEVKGVLQGGVLLASRVELED